MLQQERGKTEQSEQLFKRLLQDFGFSENVAAELWKWYEPSRKGAASF